MPHSARHSSDWSLARTTIKEDVERTALEVVAFAASGADGVEIAGARDLRVASVVAASNPPFLEHRHTPNGVLLPQGSTPW
jgi:hypothetical protein